MLNPAIWFPVIFTLDPGATGQRSALFSRMREDLAREWCTILIA